MPLTQKNNYQMKNLETRKYYAPDCSPQRNRKNDVLNNSQTANAQEIPVMLPFYQFDHLLPEWKRIKLLLCFIPNIYARLFDLAYNIIISLLQYLITEIFITRMFKVNT